MTPEKYQSIFIRDFYTCQKCGKPGTEIAHKIRQGKGSIKFIQNYIEYNIKLNFNEYNKVISKKFIDEKIIDHPFNLAVSCQKCNDYFNIFFNPVETEKLLISILEDIKIIGE